MYEARQHKDKVSRRIDGSGIGMRLRRENSRIVKQNTLIPHISMSLKSHIIQCQPPERDYYIGENKEPQKSDKDIKITDNPLANDIKVCKEKLELDKLDKDELTIEIFSPKDKNKGIYEDAINAHSLYNFEEKKIYIPESEYSCRLLLHEMGHYKQHVKILKDYRSIIEKENNKKERIGIKLLEYHNILYHENLDLMGNVFNDKYYVKKGDEKYRVSYVDEVFIVKKIKDDIQVYKEKINNLNDPFNDNLRLNEDEKTLGSAVVNKIKKLAEDDLVEVAYKTAISFYNEYLSKADLENIKSWKDLVVYNPHPNKISVRTGNGDIRAVCGLQVERGSSNKCGDGTFS